MPRKADPKPKERKKRSKANGEGTVFQRSRDGKWVAELVIGKKPDGKPIVMRSPGCKLRRDADEWLTKAKNDRNTGNLAEPSKLTVGQFLRHWLDTRVVHDVRESTATHYRYRCEKYIIPGLGSILLQKLAPMQINAFYHELSVRPAERREHLSPGTIGSLHRVLKTALRQAVEWQLLTRSPADGVRPPAYDKPKMTALDAAQITAFLDVAKSSRFYPLYLLMVTTGMRRGEALGLRWCDVDLNAGIVQIRHVLSWVQGKIVFGEPKTHASVREIPLPEMTTAALRAWKVEQGKDRWTVRDAWGNDRDLVFTTRDGNPIRPDNLRQYYKVLLQRAGLPDIRIHDLRHSALALMVELGTPPPVVQEIAGHTDIRTTLGTYGHSRPEQKQLAARAVESALGAVGKKKA